MVTPSWLLQPAWIRLGLVGKVFCFFSTNIFSERLYDDEPPQFPAIFLARNLAPIDARQLTRKMAEIFELKKI